jgi:hypothetical protein
VSMVKMLVFDLAALNKLPKERGELIVRAICGYPTHTVDYDSADPEGNGGDQDGKPSGYRFVG